MNPLILRTIVRHHHPARITTLTPRTRFQSIRRNATAASQTAQAGPLAGVKILDLTRVLAGPFCTQILADYGADVIKVENPNGGDDTRLWRDSGEDQIWKPNDAGSTTSLYFNTINRNKRSIALDLKSETGKRVALELAKRADVVVENFIPGKLDKLGLGYDALKAVNPRVILASISGYGASGPYAQRAGYDVIGAAEGGLLHITGEPDGRPTKPGVGLMDMCTGLYLHGAIVSALLSRERTGVGQKLDTSLFETTVSILANVGMAWMNLGREAQRWGTAHPTIVPYEAFKTRDSYFVLGAVNDRQFAKLCALLGREGLSGDERFVSNNARVRNRGVLKEIIEGVMVGRTTSEWEAVFQGSGMPYGPINTLEKVFAHPQALARGMVETVESQAAVSGEVKVLGIPVKFSGTKPSIREGPPSLGQHTEEVLRELGLSTEAISEPRKDQGR
ncbi:CoA-transferase family III domain-containing protein [Aspergillus pseudoustus]|uniref:CoA-transferase family III domain-containing protein n=1 Tax=Aspergillus pseudoustus TaxID=1810923 RepID=A0ABR4L1N9_9EURO